MFVKEDAAPQICTYVFRIQDDNENEDNADELQNSVQSILGTEHEVISLSKMRISTIATVESSDAFQHVIKVKTNSPTHVATKFMGNNWVREDHILFRACLPSLATSTSEDSKSS